MPNHQIQEIEGYFDEQGWHPLMPCKIALLERLDSIAANTVVNDVKACKDRLGAVTVILCAVRHSLERRRRA